MNSLLQVLVCVILLSCSSGSYVWFSDVPSPPATVSQALRVGDRVQVSVFGQEALSGEFEIRPNGELLLPVAGRVRAIDLVPDQLGVAIADRLKGVIADPRVTVVMTTRRPPQVSVLGEVTTPGRYELRDGEGVLEALARGGGLSAYAARDEIYVIRRSQGAQRVRFRYEDLANAVPAAVKFELRDGDVVLVE
jgi:polysaccharide export outer membrane protein